MIECEKEPSLSRVLILRVVGRSGGLAGRNAEDDAEIWSLCCNHTLSQTVESAYLHACSTTQGAKKWKGGNA